MAPKRELRILPVGVGVYVEPLPLNRRALAVTDVAS